ncbi:type II toxin-antitoxin system prevent-host-death family antitoxin [Streptomyces mirabilis]|uniref:type II toxin-antitoxin system Phd/YefM family antitoxin n=1 Tax=Streptomyces mirabilis TaxID=68239 RepID=UPI002E2CFE1C|nr:type II toxin-antitoxin system prevent-host-death family antitoxin [Streptomyces mirabilis]
MQRMYRTREMQTKAKEILDAAEAGEDVRITRNGRVFRVVLDDEPAEPLTSTPASDDLLGQIISGQQQANDLLRELVEQGRNDRTLDEIIERSQPLQIAEPGMVTVRLEEPEPPQNRPVVIPEAVKAPEPEKPGEPSQDELKAAYDYLGLRETPEGLDVTERGIRSALGTVKRIAREDPTSDEARVMEMGAADEDRIEFLRCVQLDKLSKALAKRAAGDPCWLGVATPPRI